MYEHVIEICDIRYSWHTWPNMATLWPSRIISAATLCSWFKISMFAGKKRAASDQWRYVVRANQPEVLSFGFRKQQVSSGAVCCVVFSSFRSSGSNFASGIIVKYAFFARLKVGYWYLFVLGHVIFHYHVIMMCVDPHMFGVTSYFTIKLLCTNAICGNFSKQYSLKYI